MAYQERNVDVDLTVALGGVNKKTGKPNPTQVEGYYIETKDIPNKLSKTGFSKLHILQTAKGLVGVFGKADLDRKLSGAIKGCMTRLTSTGKTIPTAKGEMKAFKVEQDTDNTIEVAASNPSESDYPVNEVDEQRLDEEDSDSDLFSEEETTLDQLKSSRPATPTRAPQASPSAASIARAKDLIKNRNSTAR